MRTFFLPCLALCMLLADAPRAGAHAFLEHAIPPVGGTVSTPPTEISLQFSEAIEPAFSHIKLATIAGVPSRSGLFRWIRTTARGWSPPFDRRSHRACTE